MVLQNRSDSQSPQNLIVGVPAKAMLFGEYGVLRGGRAAAMLIDDYQTVLQFSFSPTQMLLNERICLESDFFESPVFIETSQIPRLLSLKKLSIERGRDNGKSDSAHVDSNEFEKEKRNLACYVSEFLEFLKGWNLNVRVCESFSPSLGFGSSSALLVAFHVALSRFFGASRYEKNLLTEKYWQRIYQSLLLLQGKGSGYDIAAQSWIFSDKYSSEKTILEFYNPAWNEKYFNPKISVVPVSQEEKKLFGCFVQTGVRSETRQVLSSIDFKQNLDEFYSRQMQWADSFLQSPTAATARDLCRESSALARRFGLVPQNAKIEKFIGSCEKEGIAWKTMGAGHGDCLWVMTSREHINDILRRTGVDTMSVCFDFADFKEVQK